MVNVFMSQVILNRSGIMSLSSQIITTGLTQLMGMNLKRNASQFSGSSYDVANGTS
jgi:hypothetical protein